jgi:hypothetical protein
MHNPISILAIISIVIGIFSFLFRKRYLLLNIITLVILSASIVECLWTIISSNIESDSNLIQIIAIFIFSLITFGITLSSLIRARYEKDGVFQPFYLLLLGIFIFILKFEKIITILPFMITFLFAYNLSSQKIKHIRLTTILIILSVILVLWFGLSYTGYSIEAVQSVFRVVSALIALAFISVPFFLSSYLTKQDAEYSGLSPNMLPAYFMPLVLFYLGFHLYSTFGLWILIIGLLIYELIIITRDDLPLILGVASTGILTAIIGVYIQSNLSIIGALILVLSDMLIAPTLITTLNFLTPQEIKGPLARTTLWINHPSLSGVIRYGLLSLLGLPPAISFIGRLMIIAALFSNANIIIAILFTIAILIHLSNTLRFMRNILGNPPPEEYPTITGKERASYIIPLMLSYTIILILPFLPGSILDILR